MHVSDVHYRDKSWKSTTKFVVISALVFIAVLASTSLSSTSSPSSLPVPPGSTPHSVYPGAETGKKGVYQSALFDTNGRYIFRDYDEMKPMSNFLAGLGGYWGVPMWAFYVNRGQGITSFGVQNKDGGIAKFLTAEKAYQQTPFIGFRTFVKGEKGGNVFKHQPFFPIKEEGIEKPTRNMMIGMNEMEIEEVSPSHSLKTNVLYFTPPDEDFPSLVRSTTFTNLDTADTLQLDVLDGLGKLIPAGLPNWNLDAMGRTMEAWMNVRFITLTIQYIFYVVL